MLSRVVRHRCIIEQWHSPFHPEVADNLGLVVSAHFCANASGHTLPTMIAYVMHDQWHSRRRNFSLIHTIELLQIFIGYAPRSVYAHETYQVRVAKAAGLPWCVTEYVYTLSTTRNAWKTLITLL